MAYVAFRQIGLFITACINGLKPLLSPLIGTQQQSSCSDNTIIYQISRNDEAFRDHVKYFAFEFDNVLDPDLIQSSLKRLLEIDHWRKIGGRIKLNGNGRITLHVPKHFDSQNPAFTFHHEKFDMAVSEHIIAAKFPPIKQTQQSIVYPNDDFLATFARTKQAPKSIHEFVKSGSPVLSVLVSSFTDATIVGLCWPHILMDGLGYSEFLHNWSLVLAGEEDKVTKPIDINCDPMWEMADPARFDIEEDWAFGRHQLQGVDLLWFQLRYLWNAIFSSPPERRLIMISNDAFHRLVDNTRLELKKWAEEQGESKPPFISDGDILTGWIMKAANKHKTSRSSRPTILGQAFNLRPYLREDVINPPEAVQEDVNRKGVYISNMVSAVYTLLPRGFLQDEPVFRIALEQRKAVQQQTTENQVLGLLRHHRETFQRTGKYQPIFGTHDSDLYFVTNAIKLQLQHVIDLSPAIVKDSAEGDNKGITRSNLTSYVSGFQKPNAVFPGIIILKGKDQFGNIWLNPTLRRDCWRGVEEEVQRL
ncbi:uncharacterized protein BDW43DRAFT_317141 [Aspergillus alliaceus]|uniref:uncharacterized protein n=1 Tax=Petromyces alliaceus TaxID=209559 RepID=UPI0012A42C14|nr:uncharacterized protein BDW43DRAFT_317141 [Aspergillus alliaceus]KAB8227101.1 hypothetical protein BDW43DRAFT_317141 [Aspergillus alliaceus]